MSGYCNVWLSFGALDNYASLVFNGALKSRHLDSCSQSSCSQSSQAESCVFSVELNWRNTSVYMVSESGSAIKNEFNRSTQMDWDAENYNNTWNSCSVIRSLQRKRKKSVVICWYGVARKSEALPTLRAMLLRTIKRSSRRILRDLRIMWNRNAIQYFNATSFTSPRVQAESELKQ